MRYELQLIPAEMQAGMLKFGKGILCYVRHKLVMSRKSRSC